MKVEEGMCEGRVLYHAYVKKTEEEVVALEKKKVDKDALRKKRREEQEANVRRKEKEKAERAKIEEEMTGRKKRKRDKSKVEKKSTFDKHFDKKYNVGGINDIEREKREKKRAKKRDEENADDAPFKRGRKGSGGNAPAAGKPAAKGGKKAKDKNARPGKKRAQGEAMRRATLVTRRANRRVCSSHSNPPRVRAIGSNRTKGVEAASRPSATPRCMRLVSLESSPPLLCLGVGDFGVEVVHQDRSIFSRAGEGKGDARRGDVRVVVQTEGGDIAVDSFEVVRIRGGSSSVESVSKQPASTRASLASRPRRASASRARTSRAKARTCSDAGPSATTRARSLSASSRSSSSTRARARRRSALRSSGLKSKSSVHASAASAHAPRQERQSARLLYTGAAAAVASAFCAAGRGSSGLSADMTVKYADARAYLCSAPRTSPARNRAFPSSRRRPAASRRSSCVIASLCLVDEASAEPCFVAWANIVAPRTPSARRGVPPSN